MAKWRLDLLMNLRQQGWSETYYTDANSRLDLETKLLGFMILRNRLLNVSARVVGYRTQPLTDDGLPMGKAYASDLTSTDLGANAPGNKDVTNVSINVRWWNNQVDVGSKLVHMRGFPDSSIQFDANGNPTFDNAFRNPWNNWVARMVDGTMYLRTFQVIDAANAKIELTTIEYNAQGMLQVTLANDNNDDKAGMRVKLFKVKAPLDPCANGLRRIISRPTPTTMVLDHHRREGILAGQPAAGAYLRREKYLFTVINSVRDFWPSTRNTGRAFFATAGAHRNRC